MGLGNPSAGLLSHLGGLHRSGRAPSHDMLGQSSLWSRPDPG